MVVEIDPEGREKETLLSFAGDLTGKRVLEVGCGSGRLTWVYAPLAANVVGIDPDAERIRQAGQNLPLHLFHRVDFQVASIESYRPPHLFDLIIFSWSL